MKAVAKVELAEEQAILEGRTKDGRQQAQAAMRLLPTGFARMAACPGPARHHAAQARRQQRRFTRHSFQRRSDRRSVCRARSTEALILPGGGRSAMVS